MLNYWTFQSPYLWFCWLLGLSQSWGKQDWDRISLNATIFLQRFRHFSWINIPKIILSFNFQSWRKFLTVFARFLAFPRRIFSRALISQFQKKKKRWSLSVFTKNETLPNFSLPPYVHTCASQKWGLFGFCYEPKFSGPAWTGIGETVKYDTVFSRIPSSI